MKPATCKFCHRVITGNGNAHTECYWAWVHKSLGIIEGQTKEGVGGDCPATLGNRQRKQVTAHTHTGPIDYD